MNMFIDEGDIARMLAHDELQHTIHILHRYQGALKGVKCPIHRRAIPLNITYNYEQYDDGNYTRIYFRSNCCCEAAMAHAEGILKAQFPHYNAHRVYKRDQI